MLYFWVNEDVSIQPYRPKPFVWACWTVVSIYGFVATATCDGQTYTVNFGSPSMGTEPNPLLFFHH